MMRFISCFEASEDSNGRLDGWLGDKNRLEPAGKSGVLLNVLAILIERRRPKQMQLAPRKRWLQDVALV